jgi:hypothetical protein
MRCTKRSSATFAREACNPVWIKLWPGLTRALISPTNVGGNPHGPAVHPPPCPGENPLFVEHFSLTANHRQLTLSYQLLPLIRRIAAQNATRGMHPACPVSVMPQENGYSIRCAH